MREKIALFCLVLAQALTARDLGSRPLVLVHGWGPEALIGLTSLRDHLVQDGVRPDSILLVSFRANAPIQTLTETITQQLRAFLSRFPANTRFDVIGHSMGGFLGLYVPLQSALGSRLDHYTALAGWTHGQDHLPGLCKLAFGCGKTLPLLIPTDGAFLTQFFTKNDAAIHAMKKCSLWSPEDQLTYDPYNSGGFADGINVRVEGVRHLEFRKDLDVYHIFRTACYGEPAPAQGFQHPWTLEDGE